MSNVGYLIILCVLIILGLGFSFTLATRPTLLHDGGRVQQSQLATKEAQIVTVVEQLTAQEEQKVKIIEELNNRQMEMEQLLMELQQQQTMVL